jgi:hypothetical protein
MRSETWDDVARVRVTPDPGSDGDGFGLAQLEDDDARVASKPRKRSEQASVERSCASLDPLGGAEDSGEVHEWQIELALSRGLEGLAERLDLGSEERRSKARQRAAGTE